MKNQKNENNEARAKNYFIPNYKNNLLSLFIILCGYLFLWIAFSGDGIFLIPALIAAVFIILGLGLAAVRPTFTVMNEKQITIYYAFGFWRESAKWENIKNIYELDYRVGKTRDKEKVFVFEGLECAKKAFFVKSEIERSKKLGRLICEFWGTPIKKEKD